MQGISTGFSAVTFDIALSPFPKGFKLEVFTYGNRPPVIIFTENYLLSPSARSLFFFKRNFKVHNYI